MNLVAGRLVSGSPPRFEAAAGMSLALDERGPSHAGRRFRAGCAPRHPPDRIHFFDATTTERIAS